MRAGKLDKLVTIQNATISTYSTLGERKSTWEDYRIDEWANIQPVKDIEIFGGILQRREKSLVEFRMRYSSRSTIKPAMRISYGGKYYNIVSVENVGMANREIKVLGEAIE